MSGMSMGWIIGIMVGIVLVVAILKLINRNGKAKTEYDERQKLERGKAYMVAFYATIFTCAVMMTLHIFEVGIEVLGINAWFLPIIVGIITQVSYSVFHDAYEGLNTNMSRFFILMAFIGGFNLVFAVIAFVRNGLLKDGVVVPQFTNFLCGILFLILAVELLVKRVMDQRGEREDA